MNCILIVYNNNLSWDVSLFYLPVHGGTQHHSAVVPNLSISHVELLVFVVEFSIRYPSSQTTCLSDPTDKPKYVTFALVIEGTLELQDNSETKH